MRPILAKSAAGLTPVPESVFLLGHLRDVYRSAGTILATNGRDQLAAFGLRGDDWFERLQRVVFVAAAVHDLGKANNQFQAMIRKESRTQDFRHEWISVWLLEQPAMQCWLTPALDNDPRLQHVMLCCVAGHHPDKDREVPSRTAFDEAADSMRVYVQHPDFRRCLDEIARWFQLASPPDELEAIFHGGAGDFSSNSHFRRLVRGHQDFFDEHICPDDEWRRFCACAKACLIAADIAGSALWEHIDDGEARTRWLEETLAVRPLAQDLDAIIAHRLDGKTPWDFQANVAESNASVTLVEAGCGSGKTIAAYLWAARRHAGKRLWFCYPTTGTATEGFLGYLVDPETQTARPGANLFHSRSNFDKLRLLTARGDEEEDFRIRSLMTWETAIVCCTVDTLLSVMQNQRGGLYAWPAIASAAVVFDEVHCFDDNLFGNLLTFLREVPGIPVLLMTASLPRSRKAAIEKACKDRTFCVVAGPEELEKLPRYFHASCPRLAERDEAVEEARAEYERGGRVLWISNTVDRTRDAADDLADCKPVVYHSRFIYRDRLDQHTAVVEMFDRNEPGLASTSQVAEMSLDLRRAMLLVSELAPIPALIQRLGRLNRALDPHSPAEERPPRPFLIIEPLNNGEYSVKPYDEPDLELAREWLAGLGSGPLSQRDLVEAWHRLDDRGKVPPSTSEWLTGGIETRVVPIRKSGYGVTVIRQCDVPAGRGREGTAAYALPMNQPSRRDWQVGRCSGFPVAAESSIEYCKKVGARWATFLIL